MSRIVLTGEQKRAAASPSERLFIEARPGAGKTAVASERFGILRFDKRPVVTRAITAVSFTRSATNELRTRIGLRWGRAALDWPHRVVTIDALVVGLLEELLRRKILFWPGGLERLHVLDTWRGQRGSRRLQGGDWKRSLRLGAGGAIESTAARTREPCSGFSKKAPYEDMLARGRCTHEEVRELIKQTMRSPHLLEEIGNVFRPTLTHLLVDEVFDANALDLAFVDLVCSLGIAVTLVGDPWQALYAFRGANPEGVRELLKKHHFTVEFLSRSFRFRTDEMQALSNGLRDGKPTRLAVGDNAHVVLASTWRTLWNAPAHVLPVSWGSVENTADAVLALLLHHVVANHFQMPSVFVEEAMSILNIDSVVYRERREAILDPIVARLRSDSAMETTKACLVELRQAVKELGGARRPPSTKSDANYLERLRLLSRRLACARTLVPGMTIHQAKGREWERVGVVLTPAEKTRLASGLVPTDEADRRLYVALTRAKTVTMDIDEGGASP